MTTAHEQLKEQYEQSLESQEGFYLSAKAVEALLTEHRALLSKREWRDISTAPKDGTYILAIMEGFELSTIVCWHNDMWRERTDVVYDNYAEYSPTHWMPLPTPPAQKEAESHE